MTIKSAGMPTTTTMSDSQHKPLMRSLGEFVGHIVKGVRSDPARKRTIVRKEVEEEDRGNVVLRRTTIEEVEIKNGADTDTETETRPPCR